MGKELYRYSVYDMDTDKYILRDATADAVSKKINITKDKISRYVQQGYLFQRRYNITSELINNIPESPRTAKPITAEHEKFIRDWNDMLAAAQVIKNGGKIVTRRKHGKIIKYVEAPHEM